MFDIDILQSNPNTPTFYTALIVISISFVLSSLIAITYEFTTRSNHSRGHFLQALSMISIVASMIMLAIGDSLAVGLGMLGALSIIRFRTSLNNPRNITFIFASLAIGIACGVLGFSIAIVGTLLFCAAAFLLHFSPWKKKEFLTGVLRISTDQNIEFSLSGTEAILYEYCDFFELVEIRFPTLRKNKKKSLRNQIQTSQYHLRIKNQEELRQMTHRIYEQEPILRVQFAMQKLADRL